jgi:hypothetical protein
VDHDGGGPNDAIDPRFVMLNVGDVLNGELVAFIPPEADQSKIGQDVPLPWWQQATMAPQQPLPWQRNVQSPTG